jgi:hypothetical protein
MKISGLAAMLHNPPNQAIIVCTERASQKRLAIRKLRKTEVTPETYPR